LLEFENALQEYVEAADSTAFLEDHCVEVKEGLAAKELYLSKLKQLQTNPESSPGGTIRYGFGSASIRTTGSIII
jgi:hypothetical protein